jgi:hypothetical protein
MDLHGFKWKGIFQWWGRAGGNNRRELFSTLVMMMMMGWRASKTNKAENLTEIQRWVLPATFPD